ncbi:MAG: flagellar basal body P-ring protein FlgI [Candidatus Margulisbacteria bacterium]|nr:flagellar basal body P-ring protein FlgI [Candidatus Margulisiibacteriota bacterium]
MLSKNILKKLFIILFIFSVSAGYALSPSVRIKDISHVIEARANQLMGFGLVVGLRNTGDSAQSTFTQRALTNLLAKLGIAQTSEIFKSRNVAAVMVTADLPPFMKSGQRIDVIVSSMGDATSLKGGTLLQTPLHGADGKIYAVCQGSVLVVDDRRAAASEFSAQGQTTVGRVVDGALVEKSIPAKFDQGEFLTLVLDRADFTTAARLAYALDREGIAGARAVDAATVQVPIPDEERENMVDFIARVEDVQLIPDSIAKVVVNQRTGTIVIGENVRLSPVAVSHGDIEVQVGEVEAEQPSDLLALFEEEAVTESQKTAERKEIKLIKLQAGTNLSALVKALNSVGTSPKDLVAILQALKSSGALAAELEII